MKLRFATIQNKR